jgi:hypothetical protein
MVSAKFSLGVPPDSKNRPKSKIESRLLSLRRSWRQSRARIVAGEFYRFYHRIREIQKTPSLRFGAELAPSMWGHSLWTFPAPSSFLSACTESMEQLQIQHRWCGPLEVQMAAQAFRNGAQWASRSFCSETDSAASWTHTFTWTGERKPQEEQETPCPSVLQASHDSH